MDGDAFAPLRVWLEPGYDDGRVGAWLLDIPGAFGWAKTEALARSQSPSVAGRFREWLAAHGETLAIPPIRGVDIVERVAPSRHDDGTERNATFTADHRAVGAAEIATTARRLAYARSDLLALLTRVEAYEREHGTLPTSAGAGTAARGERTVEDVARHVAGAEVWLASRLGASVRYDGPDPRAPGIAPVDALAATRAYVDDRLPALHAADPAAERVDGKGETWTLAKVCRRLVYHALDHLWELDRRLARADGTREALDVSLERRPSPADARALLLAVGWDQRATDLTHIAQQVERAQEVAAAWDGDRLVGMARSLTDGISTAYLTTVIVHPRYQGLGVGARVVRALMDGRDGVRFGLAAADGLADWYATLGFEPDVNALVRRRRTDRTRP